MSETNLNRQQPWFRRYPVNELAEFGILNCEEYGLFARLRDYALVNGGIPDNEEIFKRLGQMFQLSRYKMRKLWPRIENFFTLRDGIFLFEPEETQRLVVVDIRSKRKMAGRLGAERRWSEAIEEGTLRQNFAMASAIDANGGLPSTPPLEPELDSRRVPPPPTPSSSDAGGGGAPQGEQTQQRSLIQSPVQAVQARCRELGLPECTERVAANIVQKFNGILPVSEIPANLPRYDGQHSPGLWLKRSPQALIAETQRQAAPLTPKPMMTEQQRRILERAAERDRAKAGSA